MHKPSSPEMALLHNDQDVPEHPHLPLPHHELSVCVCVSRFYYFDMSAVNILKSPIHHPCIKVITITIVLVAAPHQASCRGYYAVIHKHSQLLTSAIITIVRPGTHHHQQSSHQASGRCIEPWHNAGRPNLPVVTF